MQPAEPFILQVTNSAPTAKSFYLSQGILYTRGSETAGQLRTGRFPAIGEPAPGSLTATSLSSVSIEQFIGYLQQNPSLMYEIQATSTNAGANLNGAIRVQQQGAIKNAAPATTPLRQYATQGAFNLQFQTLRQPKYFTAQDLATITVAGNSTLTLNLYPAVSADQSAELRTTVKKAIRLLNFDGPANTCIQPQCITTPCPQHCFDANGNLINPQTGKEALEDVRDKNISPDFFRKVPPVSGKVHNWLPVIGVMAAGALFVWFVFFKSE